MTLKPYEIKGQCSAKRALEVAEAGSLRVLLVGPIGCSKTTLREAFPNVVSAEIETCPCGHYSDVRQSCICSERTIVRWYRRLERIARDFDIVLECPPVPARELLNSRQPDIQEHEWMLKRIAAAHTFGELNKSLALTNDGAIRVMEMVARRLNLTPGQYNRVLATSRAIANLGASPSLQAKHIAEAVQYRADVTMFRLDRVTGEASQ